VAILEAATTQVEQYADIVRVNPQTSPIIRNIAKLRQSEKGGGTAVMPEGRPTYPGSRVASPDAIPANQAADQERAQTLRNGILEIADVMKGDYNLGDVIYMIMETMYRGFGFDRVIFAMRDQTRTQMAARFGLGDDIDNIIRQFHFTIKPANDIFNIAITKAKGIVINDAYSPNIVKSLPDWYRFAITAASFLIYPIVVRGVCIGVIYADSKTKGLLLTESQLHQMEELREMAVDAIGQKRP
jgi:GAF domain-containing protein